LPIFPPAPVMMTDLSWNRMSHSPFVYIEPGTLNIEPAALLFP
jgi:hypothetical protein